MEVVRSDIVCHWILSARLTLVLDLQIDGMSADFSVFTGGADAAHNQRVSARLAVVTGDVDLPAFLAHRRGNRTRPLQLLRGIIQVRRIRNELIFWRQVYQQAEALALMCLDHGRDHAASAHVDRCPRSDLRLIRCLNQMWIGNKILIADHRQQKRQRRRGKRRAEPGKPSGDRSGAGSFTNCNRFRAFRQDGLGLRHKLGTGANVPGAFRAVKVVLFELLAYFAVKFVEQISFRHFLSNHRCVVHDLIPPHKLVRPCSIFNGLNQRSYAGAKSGGFSPVCLRYDDLNACLARYNSTRKYSRSTPKSRQTSSLSRSSRKTSRNSRRSRSESFSRISRTFFSRSLALRAPSKSIFKAGKFFSSSSSK